MGAIERILVNHCWEDIYDHSYLSFKNFLARGSTAMFEKTHKVNDNKVNEFDRKSIINSITNDRRNTIFKFAFVGATGALINLSLLWFLTKFGLLYYIFSASIAIEISIFWNFYFNSKITFNYKFLNRLDIVLALFKYHLSSFLGVLINILALFILTEFFHFFIYFRKLLQFSWPSD